jgi:hypothetical protein
MCSQFVLEDDESPLKRADELVQRDLIEPALKGPA